MFKRHSGAPKLEYMPKKVSTAFINGGLVYADGAGAIQPADDTSGDHFGVLLRAVVAADTDYAVKSMVPIDVASPQDLWEVDVPSAGLTTAMIGLTCDLTADGANINPAANAKGVVTIVGFISARKAIVKINAMAAHKNVSTT
jgi:hypothetical protein